MLQLGPGEGVEPVEVLELVLLAPRADELGVQRASQVRAAVPKGLQQ